MSYYKILSFQKEPFSTSPDPSFFYLTKEHDMALTNILIELHLKRGLSVIFGDVGTGKTSLSRKLILELNQRSNMVYHMILNPEFSDERQFLLYLIKNFNIEQYALSFSNNPKAELLELREAVEKFLIQKSVEERQTVILIIDEAQNLKEGQLEQIRLLSNLETEKEKLLQIILVGQPELGDKLKLSSLRQLNQRVTVRYHILPLAKSELEDYISHRLRVAGSSNKLTFTKEAIEEIYLYSGGTPRLINIICDRALLAGFVMETFTIDYGVIKKCIEEVR